MPCSKIIFKDLLSPELNSFLNQLLLRQQPAPDTEDQVRNVLQDVSIRGDEALLEYSRRFDCPNQQMPFRVPLSQIQQAAALVPGDDLDILIEASAHIREFHEAQKEKSWFITKPDGSVLGQKVEAVDRVGLYVPGGKGGDTPLISSLLMGAVPAQVVGVPSIAVVSPPRPDGTLNPYILAAAYLLDISEVYCLGGPWSIAALAFGTASIPAVDVIAGPGNIHVTTAKRLVQGKVGIDMLAGPSEILILADDSARADWIAADMLSQAEHDTLASALCITDNPQLADRILVELENRLASLPRADMARKALHDFGAVLVAPNMDMAVELANAVAPEHLEVLTRAPWDLLPKLRHAGAIFLGSYSAESVGDYFAGPNHILPTMGTARFASALGVQTFTKRSSVLAISRDFARNNAPAIARMARMEGLEAHARAAEIRNV